MTRKWLFGGMALIAVLVASAVAIAGDEGPKIDQVEASIVYTFVEGEERICEGPGDEEFVEQRVRVLGTATGSPVLTGDVELSLKLLNENSTGEAFQEGTFVIRDSDTGRKKVVAHFTDAGVAEIFQGTLVGTVKRGAKRLIVNWRTTFHPNGAVTAQIGGEAGDGRLPAIVAKGRCKGPFERVEFEIPPPEEDIAARRAAGARVGWLNR